MKKTLVLIIILTLNFNSHAQGRREERRFDECERISETIQLVEKAVEYEKEKQEKTKEILSDYFSFFLEQRRQALLNFFKSAGGVPAPSTFDRYKEHFYGPMFRELKRSNSEIRGLKYSTGTNGFNPIHLNLLYQEEDCRKRRNRRRN